MAKGANGRSAPVPAFNVPDDLAPHHGDTKVENSMTTPWPADAWYLQLADLTVDLRFRRLIHSGQSIELPQRVFDLCLLFLSEPNRLHTRTELFDRLWARTIVEDTNLSQNVWLLRKALGEERKNWVRTVAKSGYVFEAPGPVHWFKELPPTPQPSAATAAHGPQAFFEPPQPERVADSMHPAADAAAPPEPAASPRSHGVVSEPAASSALASPIVETKAAAAPPRSLRGSPGTWAVISLGLIALVAAAVLFVQRGDRSITGKRELAVALVVIEDQNPASRWPAKLLEEWLSWKLGSLPEVNLLSESDLAAGNDPASSKVVLLSSVRSPDDPKRLSVYARFQENGKEERIEVEGEPSDMPALIDLASNRILARLLPGRDAPWPALQLSAQAASRYEQAALAIERRDWMAAAAIGNEVVKAAPRFGLMRLQLAQAQTRLSQGAAATAQMEVAVELLRPLPADARLLLEAQRLAADPRREQDALQAVAVLADKYPDKIAYQVEYARLLIASGRAKDALARLADRPGQHDALGTKLAKHQVRAGAYQALGDPVKMRGEAVAAERLARDAGPGWLIERADALLSLAAAERLQHRERPPSAAYEQSAVLYERGGNSTGALYARVMARMAGPLTGDVDPALNVLLARANAGGYRRLEINVLSASADQYFAAGDVTAVHSRLSQALAVAKASGDLRAAAYLDMKLAHVDMMAGRFDSAAVRIPALLRMKMQGGEAVTTHQLAAMLAAVQGHYGEGLKILEATERLLPATPAGQAESEAHAQLACGRAEFLVPLGRLREARTSLDRCSNGTRQIQRSLWLLGMSQVELMAGDRPQALALLERAEKILPVAPPDSWNQRLESARLATWLGETEKSERVLSQLVPQIQTSGLALFVVQAMVAQAENAAARGDWADSRRHATEARKLVPDAWFVSRHLDVLAIADARQRGDRADAVALASKLHLRARQLGDAVIEMQVHAMFEPGVIENDCSAAEREAMIARTGMRGADVDWLSPVHGLARGPSH
ncbi:winged helix-turn-helix domain-containing protein [Lysobacter sp. 1R34A]|uniref:winged helix-turn-helix domain-containing protein n=1 Tax=Lysobacter sp. 1R34A TaxID=3445786 RepID=UPI003EEE11E2